MTKSKVELEGRVKLSREGGFKFLSSGGLYEIPEDFRAPLGTLSSFRTSKEFDEKAGKQK
jgi:hypothetical protein